LKDCERILEINETAVGNCLETKKENVNVTAFMQNCKIVSSRNGILRFQSFLGKHAGMDLGY
jgi:hypothetical protein